MAAGKPPLDPMGRIAYKLARQSGPAIPKRHSAFSDEVAAMHHETCPEKFPGGHYLGRILVRPYSRGLKTRVAALIKACRAFDHTGAPAIPYIAAWQDRDNIWYEFAGRRFFDLFDSRPEGLAEAFRHRVVDQRVYKCVDMGAAIEREVRSQEELQHDRDHLREEGIVQGEVDAVYKVDSPRDGIVWLKDQAVVNVFEADRICLSVGHLTEVTKEMRSEEERLEKERLQVSLEMAGAVCHELNQPLQGISSYAESLAEQLTPGGAGHDHVRGILDLTGRMGVITKKLMRITRYETKDYLKGVRIIDIDRAADEAAESD
jgi:signal transduction histidine kinase